ncbi:Alginate lyase 7 [Pontiella desulfatans]|uniref:Alginate lyase 7 n=1 Tax=Pontiella desulfatans TaxID=2750659 RepID=A0A6C2U178_PONDE|nr:right-handed parallel beta-helix repeat-containing protein [Pontiella desulfatans]VGO13645.1 Alginate lyase 7 [Pontiella desulfatans]
MTGFFFAFLFFIGPAQAPESPVYDVTAYGAVANDGLSDTAAVQAALSAATSAGGGTVYLPAGTYEVDSLNIGSNTEMIGDRAGATVLKREPGTDQPLLVAGAVSNITVRAIAFNANKAQTSGTPQCLRFIDTEDFLVADCVLHDSTGHTLYCNGTTNGTIRNCEFYDGTAASVYMVACDNIQVAGCFSRTSGEHGYQFKNCGNVKFSAAHATENNGSGFFIDSCDDVVLEGCLAQSNTNSGFRVYSTALLNQNITFNGCVARLNDTGFSITDARHFDLAGCMANENGTGMALVDNLQLCSDFSLTGCHMVGNQKEGITLLGATAGKIEGCLINNNSQSQTNAYDGIHMADGGGQTCSSIRIAGCSLIDSQPVPTQRRGITTTGGSDEMTILYNDVAGNSSTPAIQLEGTNNTATLNITL